MQFSKIESLQWDILSSEEIRKNSVVEVTESKLSGEGSVYDLRMGCIEKNEVCATCDTNRIDCGGHFGHIELSVPVFHSLFYPTILTYVLSLCISCVNFLMTPEHIKMTKLDKKQSRIEYFISNIRPTIDRCPHCSELTPIFIFADKRLFYYYKDKSKKIEFTVLETEDLFKKIENKPATSKTVNFIKFFGLVHKPKDLILRVLPVMPTCSRPYAISGDKGKMDDDLTSKYIEIIKVNNKLKTQISENLKREYVVNLEFHISTMFDNSQGLAKHITTKRPQKAIADRLKGKGGRFRGNIQGKRVDFCGRTVFNIDPNCGIHQIILPQQWLDKLTFPEPITESNVEMIRKMGAEGKIVNIIHPNGDQIKYKYAAINTKGCYGYFDEKNQEMETQFRDLIFRPEYTELTHKVGDVYKKRTVKNTSYPKFVLDPEIYRVIKKPYKLEPVMEDGVQKTEERKIGKVVKELKVYKKVYDNSGEFKYNVNDIVSRRGKHGYYQFNITNVPIDRDVDIRSGCKAERLLQTGDILALNRQPSLHKHSFVALELKRLEEYAINKTKNVRTNVANCGPLNADCDGDELNIHVPQSYETKAELMELVHPINNLTGGRDSGVVIAICQDVVTNGYRMTKRGFADMIDEALFFQIVEAVDWNYCEFERMEQIRCVYRKVYKNELNEITKKKTGKKYNHEDYDERSDPVNRYLHTGYGLFSMLLPSDLEISYNNEVNI